MDNISLEPKKAKKSNKNIKCDVTNCVYHATSDMCEASEIRVGPGFASNYKDTTCNTFIQK